MPKSTTAAAWPSPTEGDFVTSNFKFADGGSLPELRLHYRTLGALKKSDKGHATNAVLIMHGTTGTGGQFLTDYFAGELLLLANCSSPFTWLLTILFSRLECDACCA